jgi:iron(III) transport system ATP-binding protein
MSSADANVAPLELRGVSHQYGDTAVLDGVDLRVAPGEFVALLGPSGCGKTTLLRAVAGLVTPASGTITLDGRVSTDAGEIRIPTENRGVGLVFQEYALFPHMTVTENVGYGLKESSSARVNGLLELVGLAPLAHRLPASLSGGQQQRVALARALAPRPSLLLLDEPFANVDAALRDTLGQLLRRVAKEQGASVLMVTHDQEAALSMADRVVVLEPTDQGGVVIQDDVPITVYQQPQTENVARLTGPCTLIDVLGSGDTASSPFGTLELLRSQHGPAQAMLRPEQLRFVPDAEGDVILQSHQFAAGTYRLHGVGPSGPVHIQHTSTQGTPQDGATGRVEVAGPVWTLQI